MASINKQKKAKNSFCASALKQGLGRLKRIFFYDAAQRKRTKEAGRKDANYISTIKIKWGGE